MTLKGQVEKGIQLMNDKTAAEDMVKKQKKQIHGDAVERLCDFIQEKQIQPWKQKEEIPPGGLQEGFLFLYGFSLFKTSTHRVGVLNYNPPALWVVAIVIRKNHLSAL